MVDRPFFIERRLKNSLRCALVVASFTSRQLRRMYSCISALIQWMANDTEAHVALGIEALHRLHQADRAFLDQVGVRQAVAEIAARDRHHQPQVRDTELARSVEIVVRTEAQRELSALLGGSGSGSD
jgi:hypothetical protein